MLKKTLLFLLIILAVAVFFRLWKLNSIPPGLYPDVAINGNEALETLKTKNFKLFYSENNGREGLWMWLIAISFSIFGVSVWSIKIVAAIFGILTVLGLFLLTKELFEKTENSSLLIALLSSFFLATSFWHNIFSRFGFRAILLPFILVYSFYFLFKGFKKRRLRDFIVSGIFFGLGFYTYISFRFAVLILLVVLIPYWFIYKKENLQKKYLLAIGYWLLTCFIVALPIGIYFLKHPQDFVGRAAPISIFVAQNPIKEFLKSLILHLGMFNFYGDSNWRHNFAGSPMLPWALGVLFIIGIIFSTKKLISSIKIKDYSLFSVHCLLLSWFFIMLLPGILTYEGIPHSLRVIGVIPAIYIFVALGALKIYEFFNKNTEKKNLLILASILFLIATGVSEYDKYFFDWGKNKEVKGAFTQRFADIGYFLNSLPEDTKKYVIVNESGVPVSWPDGIPMPAQTPMFVESMKYGEPLSTYLLSKDLDKIKIDKRETPNQFLRDGTRQAVIVSMAYDQSILNELLKRFPEGKIEEREGFGIFKINF